MISLNAAHLNIHLGEQSLALDLDEFSAPFSGLFGCIYYLSCQNWRISNPLELYSCISRSQKLLGLQLKSLPTDFSF